MLNHKILIINSNNVLPLISDAKHLRHLVTLQVTSFDP